MKASDFLDFDRDAYLAQTDSELGLPAGWSSAQIQVESGGNANAVSRRGAMGLAQVMPDTLRTISQRAGRPLDPYSEADSLYIHREVMRENLGKFGNADDAARAYNGGWDRSRWGNQETSEYVGKIRSRIGAAPRRAGRTMSAAEFLDQEEHRGMTAAEFLDAEDDSVAPRTAGRRAADIGRSVGGAVVSAVGAIPTAVGRGMQHAGELLRGTTQEEMLTLAKGDAAKAKEYYERANALSPLSRVGRGLGWLGDRINAQGQALREGRSEDAKALQQQSTPDGNLLEPSTWKMGENPSVEGALHVGSDVLGSLAPQVATAVATRGRSAATQIRAGAAVGGAQGTGAAIQEARDFLAGMTDEQLVKDSPVFREFLDAGMSAWDAREHLVRSAENHVAVLVAPVSTVGGAATGAILGEGFKNVGRTALTRALLGAAAGGSEEGLQEVGEGVATRAGINAGAGMQRGLGEGTFGEFVLGAAGGGAVGGARGALRGGQAAAPAPAIDASGGIAGVVDAEPEPAQALALPAPVVRVDGDGNARMDGAPPPVVDEPPARVTGRADIRAQIREEAARLGLNPANRATPTPIAVDSDGEARLQGDERTPAQATDERLEAEALRRFPRDEAARAEWVYAERQREMGYEARVRDMAEQSNRRRRARVQQQDQARQRPADPTVELGVVSRQNDDGSRTYFFYANPDDEITVGEGGRTSQRAVRSATTNTQAQAALLRAALSDGPLEVPPRTLAREAIAGVPGVATDRMGVIRLVGREAQRAQISGELNLLAARNAAARAERMLDGADLELARAAIAVSPRQAQTVLRSADRERVVQGLGDLVPDFQSETEDVAVPANVTQAQTGERLRAAGVGVDEDFVAVVRDAARAAVDAGHLSRDEYLAATRAAREGRRDDAMEPLRQADDRMEAGSSVSDSHMISADQIVRRSGRGSEGDESERDQQGRGSKSVAQATDSSQIGEEPARLQAIRRADGSGTGRAQDASATEQPIVNAREVRAVRPQEGRGERASMDASQGALAESDARAIQRDEPLASVAERELTGHLGNRYVALSNSTESARIFRQKISQARELTQLGAPMALYEVPEYRDMRLFLLPDGMAGFAVRPDGDIVSVFNHPDSKLRGIAAEMMRLAVREGGRKLETFDTVMPDRYSEAGFRAVARLRWNDEHAPNDWDHGRMAVFNNGRPDLVFMVHDAGRLARGDLYEPDEGTYVVGCCRFQRHLVKVEDETGGGSWREEGHSAASSSSRRSGWSPSVG